MGHTPWLQGGDRSIIIHTLDETIGEARNISRVIAVKGEIIEPLCQARDDLLAVIVNPHELATARIEDMQCACTIKFDRRRRLEPGRFDPALASLDIKAHDFAHEPARSIQPSIRAPIHTVETASRPEIIRDQAGCVHAFRVQLINIGSEKTLRDEKPVIIRKGDGIGSGRQLRGNNLLSGRREAGNFTRQDRGPVIRSVRGKGDIIWPDYAIRSCEPFHLGAAFRVNHGEVRANDGGDVEQAIRTKMDAIGARNIRPRGDHFQRRHGRCGFRRRFRCYGLLNYRILNTSSQHSACQQYGCQ